MVIEDAAQCTMAFDLVYQSPRPEPGLCVCVPTVEEVDLRVLGLITPDQDIASMFV